MNSGVVCYCSTSLGGWHTRGDHSLQATAIAGEFWCARGSPDARNALPVIFFVFFDAPQQSLFYVTSVVFHCKQMRYYGLFQQHSVIMLETQRSYSLDILKYSFMNVCLTSL